MKRPRRRTLVRQIARLERAVRAARVTALQDPIEVEMLRALVSAYAETYGPMRVPRQISEKIPHRTWAATATYDPSSDEFAVSGPDRGHAHSETGVLLLMAARHALQTRDPTDAFAWAESAIALAPNLDCVRAEVAGHEVAQALVFEPRPFAPTSYPDEMTRGVRALLPAMRPQRRALVEDMLRKSFTMTPPASWTRGQ